MLPIIRSDLSELSEYRVETVKEIAEIDPNLNLDKLDANEVALDLPDGFKQKLAAIASTHVLANRYPDGEYYQLRQLLAEYVGFGITPHQISLGNGSDEIIRSLLIVTGLQRGSILVAEPTFSMYEILAKNLGISVVKVPRRDRDFEINLDAARQAIATHQIAAVFLVHPNSPTGNLLTDAELDWARSLPEHILVVLDEAYFEFSGHTLVPELAAHPNWVILRTFSKALRLAAYRVGYGIAHPELIAALEKVRLPYNLPTISYEAAILAISHRQELLAAIPEILTERDRLYTAIRAMGISVWASAANFLYLRTEHDHDVMQCLKQQGTAIRQTGGGLRITIGTPAQNQRTLDRLQTCLSR